MKFASGGGGSIPPFYEVLGYASGTSSPQTVSGISSSYENLMILASGSATASGYRFALRFNGNSDSIYTSRLNSNNSSDSLETGDDMMNIGEADMQGSGFSVVWMSAIADYGKQTTYRTIRDDGTASTDIPSSVTGIGSWQNEGDAVSSVTLLNGAGSGDCNPCQLVVLGYNKDATSGTTAWKQLATETISSDGDSFSLTFDKEQYLWVNLFNIDNATGDITMKFNGTTGNEYAERYADDFGSDATNDNKGGIDSNYGAVAGNSFHNYWIYNLASLPKEVIYNYTIQNGGASNAPENLFAYGKWANTSDQIESLTVTAGGGNFKAGSYCTVWGFTPT